MSIMTTHTLLLHETLPQYTNSSVSHENKIDPLMVLVGINDRWVEMEMDTDAAVSQSDTDRGSINLNWATWHQNLSPTQEKT